MQFFKPDEKLMASIGAYATKTNNRIIVDVGCGNGDLIEILHDKYKLKVIGIEPFMMSEKRRIQLMMKGIQILNLPVERLENIIYKLEGNGLILFCRPCHSDFVENCLSFKHPKTEALYITVPENLDLYDDLGDFKNKAKIIELEGTSEDNEIIMSII